MYKALGFISVALFSLGFWICKLAYPAAFLDKDDERFNQQSVDDFTDLRYNLYAIAFGCVYLGWLKENKSKELTLAMSIGFGLSISDLMDRFISSITTFTDSDKIIVLITIFISVYNYVRPKGVIQQ